MDRREFLEGSGALVGALAVAGCGSVVLPNDPFGGEAEGRGTQSETTGTTPRRSGSSVPARPATTQRGTDAPPADSTTRSTTTGRVTRTTQPPTPRPPANRLLRPEAVGEGWRYAAGSAPTERGNGTITAVYETAQGPRATLRTRIWPCEGEPLANLGGTCSLGTLPERYRAMDGIETATPAVGESAFAWWSDSRTDIEVVANDHVFRTTYTPARPDTAPDGITDGNPELRRLTGIARQQATKLAAFE